MLSVQDIAKAAGVSEFLVLRWIHLGGLPGSLMGGRRRLWVYPVCLSNWMDRTTVIDPSARARLVANLHAIGTNP